MLARAHSMSRDLRCWWSPPCSVPSARLHKPTRRPYESCRSDNSTSADPGRRVVAPDWSALRAPDMTACLTCWASGSSRRVLSPLIRGAMLEDVTRSQRTNSGSSCPPAPGRSLISLSQGGGGLSRMGHDGPLAARLASTRRGELRAAGPACLQYETARRSAAGRGIALGGYLFRVIVRSYFAQGHSLRPCSRL